MTFVSYEDANDVDDRFLALLSRLKIQPPIGSSFEDELLSITHLIEVLQGRRVTKPANWDTLLRAAAGVHDFAAKILSVETICEWKTFEPHLQLIANSKINTASFSQNVDSSYNDDTARKMAELYIGCLAAHVGTQVELDHPEKSKGDNPDVIFKIDNSNGKKTPEKWALAIKTISSTKGQTIFERIKEGGAQIDAPKCNAQRGMVVINTKNALDHDALWATQFTDYKCALNALCVQLQELAESATTNREQSECDKIFTGRVSRPVLFLGQSLARVRTFAGPETPTPLKILLGYDMNGELDPVAVGISKCMNDCMQTILGGIPEKGGQLPCVVTHPYRSNPPTR